MLNKLRASTNLYLLVVIMSIFIMGIGAYGIKEMDAMNENTQTLYADRVFPLQQLTTIRFSYAIGILSATEQARTSQLTFEQAEKQVEQAQETIAINWNAYMQTYLTPKEKQLAAQEFALINQSTISIEKLKAVLDKKNPAALDAIITKELYPAINPVVSKLNELIDLQVNVSGEVYKNSNEVYTAASGKFLLLIFLSLVFAIILSYYLIGNIKDMIKNLWKSNAKTAESEEKYRSLIEHAGDPIFLLNEDRSFNDLNTSACKLLGYSREEFKSLKITDVYTVEELEKRPLQWDVLGKDKAIISERRLRRKDKTEVDVEFNIRVLEGKGYLAIARDITERKNAERIIKASEEKYRSLVEHAGDAIFMVGGDTFIIDVNQSACEMLGYTRQEFQHMKALDLHPSDESRMLPEEWDLLWKNKTLLNERRLQRKDGTKVEVEISRKLLADGQGYLAIVRDITERKKTDEQLKEYKHFFNHSNDLSCIANVQGYIEIPNPQCTKLLGYSEEEVIEKQFFNFIHPDDIPATLREVEKLKSGEASINFVNRYRKKNGDYLWFDWNTTVDTSTGKLYAIARDITERKKTEEILRESEKKYRGIFENSPDIILIINRSYKIKSINRSVPGGIPMDRLIGIDSVEALPENSREAARNAINKCFDTGVNQEVEGFLGFGNWARSRFVPITYENGAITHIMIISTNITEQKKAEEKTIRSEARLKEAQAVAHMGNWEIDMVNDIHIWSDELYKIFGVNKTEVTPSIQALLSFIHPDEQSFAQEQIKEAFVTLFESSSNFRFIKKDTAAIRYALIEWRFEFDGKGTPIRLYGILQDITERTEAAANLKAMEKKMSEEKLRKQQEITAAVISAQEKERAFLGEELHDNINQILATSKLYIEVAIGDKDVRKDLMTDSRIYLMNAMEEIRKLSKSLLPPSLDGESLRNTLSELIENIEQVKQINFIKEWDNIDESSIHEKASLAVFRIVQEQLNNILKYADAKTVVISLRQNGNTFQLRIKDDGIGFDTAEKRKGIGLKNIVSRAELLNGDMAINSSPGEGCELIVNFNGVPDEV